MAVTIYQIDAFTNGDEPFTGNPAAVCLLPPGTNMDDSLRQKIAFEKNLSETAFLEPVVAGSDGSSTSDIFTTANRFRLRWFTPETEVPLCGHATLAAAASLIQGEGSPSPTLLFDTVHSGQLSVKRLDDSPRPQLQLDMPLSAPSDPVPSSATPNSDLVKLVVGGLPVSDVAFHAGLKYLVINLGAAERRQLEALEPDMMRLRSLQAGSDPVFGIIATSAPDSDDRDFLSRFWAPWALGGEDPVTGSAHAVLGPYWAERLNKQVMPARQCSRRVGELIVEVDRESSRVRVSGKAVVITKGQLYLPENRQNA